MKRVSFEVAKYLKEIGYPQGWECDEHYCLESEGEYGYQIGSLVSANTIHKNALDAMSAPTYLEAWLWLWREKKIYIDIDCSDSYTSVASMLLKGRNFFDFFEKDDPEEAIIEAIEHVVKNNLIK